MKKFYHTRRVLSTILSPLTVADRILVVIFLLLGVFSLILRFYGQSSGELVEIFIDNNLKYSYSISQNVVYEIKTPYGFMNIKIEQGKVWVENSSCPKKYCKKMGKISKTNQSIACVPNHVFIQIKGKNEGNWIDIFTY